MVPGSKLTRLLLSSAWSKSSLDGNVFSRAFSVWRTRNMRYVQFRCTEAAGGVQRLGVQLSPDGDIVDLSAVDSTLPNNLVDFLAAGEDALRKAKRIITDAKSVIPLDQVTLLAPVTRPDKVACVALNYRDHCDEQNIPHPTEPVFFSKFSSTILAPNGDIQLPKISDKVDWEAELAVVIGKQAKSVRPDQAEQYIFGYTVAQDVTARDWVKERNRGQYLLGKSMDTFCPLGPAVVCKEAVPDRDHLKIRSWVNGELKQDGSSFDMIFKVDYLVSYLSHIVTLLPGDVILTGTPCGVGVHRVPQEFLKVGDTVETEIEGIGKLRNKCV